MKSIIIFALMLFAISAVAQIPEAPTDPEHPGSLVYPYEVERQTIRVDNRNVEVFLPVGVENAPVISFGHGQALGVAAYELSFEHLARKGYAVIFPDFDTGFFDQNWKRQGQDFASQTEKTIAQFSGRMNPQAVVYSGHSKGGYAALTAAILPANQTSFRPQALVLFNLAGYVKEWVENLDPEIPVTITWSVEDTIIKEPLVREIYDSLPSKKKQLITLNNYSGLEADHFFPMSKSYFFGGKDGISPFHYYGTWKWLIAAADDIVNKSGQTNPYLYGDLTGNTGSSFLHKIEKTFSDNLVFLNGEADLSQASSISNRTERVTYVYNQLRKQFVQSQNQFLATMQLDERQVKPLYIANALLLKSVPDSEVQSIRSLSFVKKVSPDTPVRLQEVDVSFSPDFFEDIPTPIRKIRANEAWETYGVRGENIVIAGQDTGYDWTHPAIQKQYRGYSEAKVSHDYNWFDATANPSATPYDDSSHGTHTMGNMVGDGGEGRRIGVAPNAKWIGCRNMLAGVGKPSTYISCFQFMLAPHAQNADPAKDGRPELAPHIVNNSWACPEGEGCSGDDLLSSVQAMRAAGIFVVVAAGNEGDRCETIYNAPAMYSGEVFSVGAFNTFINDMAWFSSRGPSRHDGGLGVDLVAPGAPVTSSVPGGGYESKMGTSMASPHVAGAVALLWSKRPELIGDIEATTSLLHKTATPKMANQSCGPFKGGSVPNAVWGHGFLDVMNLLAN